MKKYIVPLTCLFVGLATILFTLIKPEQTYFNDYPNLPAPIGKEDILFTSVGQAVEGEILYSIGKDLHLDGGYRPRALATDLYDYHTLVIVIGYSPTGLLNTIRNFEEEKARMKLLLEETAVQDVPVILLHLAGTSREYDRTWELIKLAIPYADYFIGLKSIYQRAETINVLRQHNVPFTLVNNVESIKTPFNSAFR